LRRPSGARNSTRKLNAEQPEMDDSFSLVMIDYQYLMIKAHI